MPAFDPSIAFRRSPHSSSRQGHDIVGTVIHYTAGGTALTSIEWCLSAASRASWHFIVDRDGTAYQQVDLADAAWHAGESEWLYKGAPTINVNRFTLGIELANHGLLTPHGNGYLCEGGAAYRGEPPVLARLSWRVATPPKPVTGYWEPFPEAQMAGLERLLGMLRARGFAAADTLAGHDEVCRPLGRKVDPSAAFPWQRFGRPEGTRLTASGPVIPDVVA